MRGAGFPKNRDSLKGGYGGCNCNRRISEDVRFRLGTIAGRIFSRLSNKKGIRSRGACYADPSFGGNSDMARGFHLASECLL